MIQNIFVVTGDWHLRKDVPVCRSESEERWQEIQFQSADKVLQMAEDFSATTINTGDLYHRSQPYYGIVNRFNRIVDAHEKTDLLKIAGNHDLPYHSFENAQNSGWMASWGADATELIHGAFHFGQDPVEMDSRKIVITHQLVFESEKDRPMETIGKTAAELLEEFPEARWIFTGDYHRRFHYEKDGRHVINPGCLTRQAADFADYKPGVYLVNISTGTVEWFEIGIDTEPLETNYLEAQKEREGRMDAFIEVLQSKGAVSLSFEDNLKKKLKNKAVSEEVRKVITEITEEIA